MQLHPTKKCLIAVWAFPILTIFLSAHSAEFVWVEETDEKIYKEMSDEAQKAKTDDIKQRILEQRDDLIRGLNIVHRISEGHKYVIAKVANSEIDSVKKLMEDMELNFKDGPKGTIEVECPFREESLLQKSISLIKGVTLAKIVSRKQKRDVENQIPTNWSPGR